MKKKFSLFILFCLFISKTFALPGFDSYLPDSPGDFVFYRDYSFERESYIGILSYDKQTYQIKYVAPANKEQLLPEKSVGLLFTINPESDFLDMTGERILTSLMPDSNEIDILNYLHDILYEFSSRRKKVFEVNSRNVTSKQQYPQFGGEVSLSFDCVIPLFNLKSITDSEGKVIFECVTIGKIKDSLDTTFDNFNGFPVLNFEQPSKVYKSRKKKQKVTTNFGYNLTLDKGWSLLSEGIWGLNDNCLIISNAIPFFNEDLEMCFNYLIRMFLSSANNSYIDFSTAEIYTNQETNQLKLYSTHYNKTDFVKNIKIITPEQKEFSLLLLAVTEPEYTNKRNYFDKIIKSYSK